MTPSRTAVLRREPPGERRAVIATLAGLERFLGYATIFVLPLVSFPLPGLTTTAVAPLAAPLALLTCGTALATRSRRASVPTWLVVGWLAFLAALILSYAPLLLEAGHGSVDVRGRLVRAWLPLASATIVMAAFAVLTRSPVFGPSRVVRGLVGSAAVYAVVTLMALATAVDVPVVRDAYAALRDATTTSGRDPIGGLRRVSALAFEPSFAGFEFVGWWLPLAIAGLVAKTRLLRRHVPWMFSIFLLGAIGTRTLTAAIGLAALFAIGYVITLLRIRNRLHRTLVFLIAPVIAAGAAFAPQSASVLNRLASEAARVVTGDILVSGPNDASIAVRAALLHTGLRVGAAHRWTGAGFGIAGYEYPTHRPAWTTVNRHMAEFEQYLADPDGRVFPTPKNLYARVLSEAGPFALVILLALLAAAIARAGRIALRPSANPEARLLATAATLGLAGSIVGYVSLDSFGIPYLWAWLGIAAGLRTA